jgi:hypothetical protein
MLGIQLSSDGFKAKIHKITGLAKNPREVMLSGGRAGANLLKRHFRKKNSAEPNKLGGRRSNFWTRVAESVSAPATEGDKTVVISVTDPRFAQKVFGGTIRAKRARNLTIPQTAEAYDRRASVFERETGLKLFFIRSGGKSALAAKIGNAVQVEYILKPEVEQQADPTALPPQDQLEEVVAAEAQRTLDKQLKQIS